MTASHVRVLGISFIMLIQLCRKLPPFVFIPRISFTWEVTMIKATAEVNPDDTGPDTKSIIKPKTKILSKNL